MNKLFRIIVNQNPDMIINTSHEHVSSGMTSDIYYQGLQDLFQIEAHDSSILNQEYLLVTPNKYCKVKVLELEVNGDSIIIEFIECTTLLTMNVRVDAGEVNPLVLFICWNDVKRMVVNEDLTSTSSDELLEFDF